VKKVFNAGEVKAVPPNLLYFEMILEAFLGYKITYNSKDPTLPRAALMGGAVVAALTAWRDRTVIHKFKSSELDRKLLKATQNDQKTYLETRDEIIAFLLDYFCDDNSPKSGFSTGDADIFLQASPLTRSLVQSLMKAGLSGELLDEIGSYLGGSGIVHEDLHRFANQLCGHLWKEYYSDDSDHRGKFIYALAKNGLSAMMGKDYEFRRHY